MNTYYTIRIDLGYDQESLAIDVQAVKSDLIHRIRSVDEVMGAICHRVKAVAEKEVDKILEELNTVQPSPITKTVSGEPLHQIREAKP